MKNRKLFFILVSITLFVTSCRYEEGPGISIYSPENRLYGYWELNTIYKNGEAYSEDENGTNYAIKKGCFYTFYRDYILSVNCTFNNTVRYSYYGYWQFSKDEKDLTLNFELINRKYNYTARIKKLSQSELIFEYEDESGDQWRLELIKNSTLY